MSDADHYLQMRPGGADGQLVRLTNSTTSMDGVMTDCDSIVTVDFYLEYPQGSNFKG